MRSISVSSCIGSCLLAPLGSGAPRGDWLLLAARESMGIRPCEGLMAGGRPPIMDAEGEPYAAVVRARCVPLGKPRIKFYLLYD